MESLDGQRRGGAAQGDSRFGWGPIGVSQNGGRRGEENDEGKRGVKKGNAKLGCVVCLHVLNHSITLLLLVHHNRSIKQVIRGREPLR